MTSASMSALLDPACPQSAYLSALEQGGVLITAPLFLAILILGWTTVSGSVCRKGMATSIHGFALGAARAGR